MLGYYLILFSIFYVPNQTLMWSEVTSFTTGVGSFNKVIRAITSCILPAYPDHGTYDVLNVKDAQPGQSYDQDVLLSVRCDQGYGMDKPSTEYGSSLFIVCEKGEWFGTIPKCIPFCKLDPDPSVNYRCLTPTVGFVQSCHGYLAPGTTVSPECKSPDYYSDKEFVLHMECTRGRWNYIAKCEPVCGTVVDKSASGLVVGGTFTRDGMVPWHVGLYHNHEQICGGSIVSSKVVITAAHCFVSRKPSDYAVAAGKLNRMWDSKVDANAQKSDVKEILIRRVYQGDVGRFGSDIAALILTTPFKLNPFVRPVCLSFVDNFDKWQLRHGSLGKVAGWGLTAANGSASDILKVVDFPVISEDTCLNTIPEQFRPYITEDKFCAGYTNGTALCRGDSGGGLAIPQKEQGEDRFYLRGIVSVAATSESIAVICNHLTYTAFTRVAKYQDFIRAAITASERMSCQGTDCDEDCADGSCSTKPVTSTEMITPKPDDGSCEWEGLKGQCVPAKVCLTSLDEKAEKHPVCPDKEGTPNNICCTDCQLVNDTRNFVLSPQANVFWKDGRKARDACIQFMKDLPHKCYQEGKRVGIRRDRDGSCHRFLTWEQITGDRSSGWEHPYVAVLGPGGTPKDTNWYYVGTIISEKFILGNAYGTEYAPLTYAAVGAKDSTKYNPLWQTHAVKKMHIHPEYKSRSTRAKYNDIALIELETSITFSIDVLPACLPEPAEEFDVTNVKYYVWEDNFVGSDLKEINTDDCNRIASVELPQQIDRDSQLCYSREGERCLRLFDESTALVVTTQYSRCMNTVIGIASVKLRCEAAVFIKVKHYTPWIEGVVWPS